MKVGTNKSAESTVSLVDKMRLTTRTFRPDYIPEVDGLRALAVIAVIVNHFNADFLPSGFLGVDIFFVISGYVITSSICSTASHNLGDLLTRFYARRIKRLVPALVACVVITSIVICLFNPAPSVSLKTGVASLFGLSNMYLLRQATDYFGASAQLNTFTHTWSLGVEEQFYLFFPLILWFAGGSTHPLSKRRWSAFKLVAALTTLSFIAFLVIGRYRPHYSFFLMPTRFWELSTGALLFLGAKNLCGFLSPVTQRFGSPALIATLAVTLCAPIEFAVYTTPLIVITTLLLLATLRLPTDAYRPLSHPVAVHIGRISYSLYLWHWSVLSISRWTVGIDGWSAPFLIVLMVLLAECSHRYIERPLRQADWSPHRWKIIAYGLGALCGSAIFLALVIKPLDSHLYVGKRAKLIAEGVHTLTNAYVLKPGSSTWQGASCVLSDNAQVGGIIRVDACTLGSFVEAKRRVLVVGNSFSAAFVQAFDELVKSDEYAVTITSSWGASPVAEVPNTSAWNKANDYYWSIVVPSLAAQLQTNDVVLLMSDLSDFSPKQASADTEARLMQLEEGVSKLAQQLHQRGIHLAMLHGNAFTRDANCEPSTAIKQWFSPTASACGFYSKQETLLRRSKLDMVLLRLMDQRKVTIIDPLPIFCAGEICSYESVDGQMLYRDVYSHPSVEGARLLAPLIRSALVGTGALKRIQ